MKIFKFSRIFCIFIDLFTLKVNIKWSKAFKANNFCSCKLNYNQLHITIYFVGYHSLTQLP